MSTMSEWPQKPSKADRHRPRGYIKESNVIDITAVLRERKRKEMEWLRLYCRLYTEDHP